MMTGRGSWRGARGAAWAAVFSVLTGAPGCGRDSGAPPVVTVFPVKGRVLLAKDKPLKGGRVSFVPTGEPYLVSSADVGPDGTFSLTTGDSGEGAPAGDYKVRVEPTGPPPMVRGGKADPKVLPFPPKYLDEDSSGLKVSVQAGANALNPFVLK